MAALFAYFGHKLPESVIKLYWSRLKCELSECEFKTACTHILDNFKPTSQVKFPLIPEFLNATGKTGTSRVKNAIADLKFAVRRFGRYDSVDFGDSKLHQTIKYYGGWIKICDWTDYDWGLKEKSFIETYNSMKEDTSHSHLSGLHEINNTGRFKVVDPKPVYISLKKKPLEKLAAASTTKIVLHENENVKQLTDKIGEF